MNYQNAPVPLSAPLPGASFGQAVSRYFRKYATFTGRASRSEFWWAEFFIVLVHFFFIIVLSFSLSSAYLTGPDPYQALSEAIAERPWAGFIVLVWALWALITIIPTLALWVRRLHDVNMSGWWVLLAAFTGIGTFFILIVGLIAPNPAGVRYDLPPQ